MIGKRFKPVPGKIYTNKGGGTFLCKDIIHRTPHIVEEAYSASMVNTKSGWTFFANGLIQYEDGTIEWDYSTGGRFEEVPA